MYEGAKPKKNEQTNEAKDLKSNISTENTKSKSTHERTFCDGEQFQEESLISNYQPTKAPVPRNEVKLPRNVVVDEPWPQPLLPPLSPQHFVPGAISLPTR